MNSVILKAATRIIGGIVFMFAVYLLWRGHHDPGGGFIAALVASTGFALIAVVVADQVLGGLDEDHAADLAALLCEERRRGLAAGGPQVWRSILLAEQNAAAEPAAFVLPREISMRQTFRYDPAELPVERFTLILPLQVA